MLPEVKPTKVIPKTAQVMPLLSSGKKKKENIRGLPVEGNRNGQIDRERKREPGKPPFDLSAIESLGFTSC